MSSFPRLADRRLVAIATTVPALAIVGARAVGKTTSARGLAVSILSADEPSVRASLNVDPDTMLSQAPKPVLIDEWQMAPEIIGAVKRAVDRGVDPGTFLLTGSADPRAGMHAAAGRLIRLPMHPLAQVEIDSKDAADLDSRATSLAISRLFAGERRLGALSITAGRDDVIDRIVRTGFPAVVLSGMDDRLRSDWLDGYLAATLALDPDSDAVDGRRLRRYLDAVRATSGMIVTDQSLREAADIATNTARSYQDLLERIHVVDVVPAWSGAALAQLLKAPKRFVVDAALGGHSRERLISDPTALGPVLETFVHQQLAPLGSLGPRPFDLYHLRTAGGQREVDFILEDPSGGIVAIEVKAARGAEAADARHLTWLRDSTGDRFLGGLVLHLGPTSSILSDRIWAMPVSSLWESAE